MSVFMPSRGKVKPPKRNRVDLSRQSLFTTDWGKIYPFCLIETLPGDSFEIDASVGFRAMQTKFPLQNRIRLSMSWFYVRNKNLWKEWEDFIFKTKGSSDGVVHPWLHVPQNSPRISMFETGGLGDALGLPTTVGTSQSSSVTQTLPTYPYGVVAYSQQSSWTLSSLRTYLQSRLGNHITLQDLSSAPSSGSAYYGYLYRVDIPPKISVWTSLTLVTASGASQSGTHQAIIVLVHNNVLHELATGTITRVQGSDKLSVSIPQTIADRFSDLSQLWDSGFEFYIADVGSDGLAPSWFVSRSSELIYVSSDIEPSTAAPYIGDNPACPVSALAFRAYEQVCNYWFRNDLNSPYILNGQAQYNEFIPTHDGGADDHEYKFHFHNWELDRFTSALQTPQFGAAPLVGLTYNVGVDGDRATLEFQDADNAEQKYKADMLVRDDKFVEIVNFSEGMPSANLRQLMEMVNAGFSINTLRTVNSFQRFLENCQRRGLRYRNQLQSHFGINVDYPDIDVPEYIGGASDWAQIGQVTNMAEMPDTGLGDYIGTLSGMCKGKHKIRHYCHEHGFIIGMFTIYPVPIYSQSCDKVLLKSSPFDYYQTEFGKIGFVPVHYSEVSPLQCSDQTKKLDDVFGYQRAWYDYLSAMDTVHGDFRTDFRDFMAQRLFDEPPILSEDFVRVNPLQLNDIFTTRNIANAYGSSSRFLCSAYSNIKALRPIPVHGVPSLE